jgi:hypothetical protein
MDIDCEEKEGLMNDRADPSSLVVHSSCYQEELVETTRLVDLPKEVRVIRKILAWFHDTLQDVVLYATPRDTFREKKLP